MQIAETFRVVGEIPNDMPSPELVELEGAGRHEHGQEIDLHPMV